MISKRRFDDCNNFGKLIILIGCLLFVPLFVLPFYPSEFKYGMAFLIPALTSIILGIGLCVVLPNHQAKTKRLFITKHGNFTVLFTWFYGFIAGAIPFVLTNQLNIVQALFESVSGWTTTGLSVVDVETTPHIFLFHRSFMQFLGGLGFVMVMVIFIQGQQSMNLFNAEGHPDKLMPNLKKTAQLIFSMFSMFLTLGTIAYVGAGMNVFESIIHTMSALSTGGFSSRADSIGAFDSLAIEVITIILMLIGTTNFVVLLLITKRRFKEVQRVSEVRFMGGLLLVFTLISTFTLVGFVYSEVSTSFRISFFNIVSALSTTGFSTVSYQDWPAFNIGILIILMLIGGGFGSTAGGIKLTRVYLLMRLASANIKKRMIPSRRVTTSYYYKGQNKTEIDHVLIDDTTSFIAVYFFLFLLGSGLFTLITGTSIQNAMFEFGSTLGTVGLSIGLTTPDTEPIILIIQMVGMIMGRLEIFIVIVGFYTMCSLIKERVTLKKRSKRYMA